ncbi:hypothetical protein VIM7927_03443 [Vibrio mangrovi]|uniref:Uncharacterized protein n=1 Tax=Vibrio mangrovi TaxID=474394 RepID=A0A1Y6IWS1_9VIBR|nr:hypothetical protein VIM7927_03443 [Vibrio mangrovi]
MFKIGLTAKICDIIVLFNFTGCDFTEIMYLMEYKTESLSHYSAELLTKKSTKFATTKYHNLSQHEVALRNMHHCKMKITSHITN